MYRLFGVILVSAALLNSIEPAIAQEDEEEKLREELEEIASVDEKVMVPMRDGIRLATDIYRPKDS